MKHGIAAMGSAVVVAMVAIACGGPKGAVAPPTGTDTDASAPANVTSAIASPGAAANGATATTASATGAASATVDAGAGRPEKPFAHNAEEATSFIDDAITSRSNDLVTCVNDARTRKKDPHAKIVIEVGIDEEGHLLGVQMPKGAKADKPLVDCFLTALRGAPFPRSHAGVITVRRTFEDRAVTR